jgi:hypothetical protein
MTERIDNIPNKDSLTQSMIISGALGSIAAIPSYLIARVLSDPETASRWGIGIGGGLASSSLGIHLSNLSFERAEDQLEQGNFIKARFQAAKGILEGTIGCGVTGAIAGSETSNGSISNALIGAAIGSAIGGVGSYLSYHERTRPLPDLTVLPGNSIYRDLSYPDRASGIKYPPVYRVSNLEDLLEFRASNKETIVKWARSVPTIGDPTSIMADRLLTSIFIVSNVEHNPADDPIDPNIRLLGDKKSIIAEPSKESHMFWPYQTQFESLFGESRNFEDTSWEVWKKAHWKKTVVLLTQYQQSGVNSTKDLEAISDKYWLVDFLRNDFDEERIIPRNSNIKGVPVYRPKKEMM